MLTTEAGKISVQPHTTLCIQFLNRENNDKNNTLPLGKQICFTIVWGCAEIFTPKPNVARWFSLFCNALNLQENIFLFPQFCWFKPPVSL